MNHVVQDMKFFCIVCKKIHETGACEYEGLCWECKKRPATRHFGDMLTFTHGGEVNSCEICSVERQLDHAVERAAAIPELKSRLGLLLLEEDKKDRPIPGHIMKEVEDK